MGKTFSDQLMELDERQTQWHLVEKANIENDPRLEKFPVLREMLRERLSGRLDAQGQAMLRKMGF